MKNKILFALVLILVLFSYSKVYANELCSQKGYTVLTINGINTDLDGAIENKDKLARKFLPTYNNEPLTFDYIYNPTHGIIVDSLDTTNQIYFNQASLDINDSDFAQMLTDASQKVTTQKVLLVGHSQGNFYANTFYDTVADQPGGVPSRSIGVYGVASPSNHVAGGGLYITSDTDGMISKFVANFPFAGILKPNVHIVFNDSDDGGLGHSFSKIYLAYQGDRIVSDIKTSLDKLKENDEQDTEDTCISPPKLTLTQKIQGEMFAVIDPISIPIQSSAVSVVGGAIKTAIAIGNGINNSVAAISNTIGGLLASPVATLQKDAKDLTTVSPDVIDSISSTTTANTSPKNNSTNAQTPVSQNVSVKNTAPSAPKVTYAVSNFSGGGGGGGIIAMDEENSSSDDSSTSTDDSSTTSDGNIPPTIPSTPDIAAPIITVLGDNPASVTIGTVYTDAGATALDDVDGTRDIVTYGTVDTTTAGAYTITYTATDSSGNVGTATRVVNVVEDTTLPPVVPPSPISYTTTIDKDTTLPVGEHTYQNLLITNNATLTLEGDPNSSNSFKGVKIDADNITIDPGSSISADGKGYGAGSGPGASSEGSVGASYGGLSQSGGSYSSTYGSATKPIDLGSGGAYAGGGAIYLSVSETFTDNGIVSSNGNTSSSGGSIYLIANNITGSGIVRADGGALYGNGYFKSPGGGGRVALYYQNYSFDGTVEAKGGCGSYDGWSKSCAQDGTVGLFDETNNNLYLNDSWEFLKADEPLTFNNIYILNGAQVTGEDGVSVTANNLSVDKNSSLSLADNEILNIPTITIDGGSILTLSGTEKIVANTLTVTGTNSTVTVSSGKVLSLAIPNIIVNSGSSISADGKGYGSNQGPGASSEGSVGASYGGLSQSGGSYSTTYGSATNPTDFGSGGAYAGGGAIKLVVSNTLKNDGVISAVGNASGSGGSLNITANNLIGAGDFNADGGALYGNGYFKSPGGGGRVALYYQNYSFDGTVEAKGGCGSYDGWSKSCAQDGTVGLFDKSKNDFYLNGSSWKFLQADAPFSFNNIYVSGGTQITSENGVSVTANNFVLDKTSSFSLADNQILNIPNITIEGGSTLTLSGTEKIAANVLTVTGNSTVTVLPQKILSLTIPNITVDSGSYISADGKGYSMSAGPGSSTTDYVGASYGGVGSGNTATSTYGSETEPVDFGSGGNGNYAGGGGSIRLISSNLINNGIISANGNSTSSGGSIYVTANNLSGSGTFEANGGGAYCPYSCYGPGGGGRVAIYYQTSSFGGTTIANGVNGYNSYGGVSGNGTVDIINESVNPPPPVTPPTTLSSDKAITSFNFSGLVPSVTGMIDETNHAISLTVPYGADVTALIPTITISDKASIIPDNDNNIPQNFTNPVVYIVTAEDGTTQNYAVTVVVAPNPILPPVNILPTVTSYTFNGVAGNITANPTTTNSLALVFNTSENVSWTSIKIEKENNTSGLDIYKTFDPGASCDGKNICVENWDGGLSRGGVIQNGDVYEIKVHIKDVAGNEFYDYVTPYLITIDTSI